MKVVAVAPGGAIFSVFYVPVDPLLHHFGTQEPLGRASKLYFFTLLRSPMDILPLSCYTTVLPHCTSTACRPYMAGLPLRSSICLYAAGLPHLWSSSSFSSSSSMSSSSSSSIPCPYRPSKFLFYVIRFFFFLNSFPSSSSKCAVGGCDIYCC
jgi:hypothetical protein